MTQNDTDNGSSSERFYLDRKLTIAISFFAVAGLLLMLLSNIAATTMSSLRAYSTLQGNWTREREDAVFHVHNYVEHGQPEALRRFNNAVDFIRTATRARELMEKAPVQYKAVRQKFRAVDVHPEDIPGMIRTYVWLNEFSYFVEVVNLWERSDRLAMQLDTLAHRVQMQREQGNALNRAERERFKAEIMQLDQKLTDAQKGINNYLGLGVRLLESITFWSSMGAGLVLLVIGLLFTYRFRRSIRKWRQSLVRNEKRYRSLFDHNPNAVFSLDHQGQFLSGNQALEEMTGYSKEELHEMTYLPLVHPDYVDDVQHRFEKALSGKPQSYESVGLHRDGYEYEVHVTNLPIIVDGKIEGVYGIAQNISDRKQAERKLRRSLEEKKALLSEIHHRVKNNLAIISGLLQLQAENMQNAELKYDLLNTQSRIHSMAMVHEKLYKSESLSDIRMPAYIRDLSDSIRQTLATDVDVSFEFDCDEVSLDITQAIPCGLLLNEIIVNAYKYAFVDRPEGIIGIRLREENGSIYLKVYDDGVGIPEDFDLESSSSLGMSLINSLTKQLQGSIEVESNKGTIYKLQFEKEEPKFLQTGGLD